MTYDPRAAVEFYTSFFGGTTCLKCGADVSVRMNAHIEFHAAVDELLLMAHGRLTHPDSVVDSPLQQG